MSAWDTVAKVAKSAGAAVLGGLVPGGGVAVDIIASAFGADPDDPESLARAINADPQAAAKLRQVEAKHRETLERIALEREQAQLRAETAMHSEVNATMRAELAADSLFKSGWRPWIGWLVGTGIGALLAALATAIFRDPSTAPTVIENATALLVVVLGLLGYNVRQRTVDKLARMGQQPRGLIEQLGALRQKADRETQP